MRSIILLIIISFCFISCNNDLNKTIISNNTNFSIKIDTISISIDSTFLQYYSKTNFNKRNNKLYCYNSILHRIDYLSFENNTDNGYIQLQKDGPNGIKRVNDVYVKSEDQIFLISYNRIVEINSRGEITLQRKINSTSNKEFYKSHFLFPSQDSGFEYSNENDNFYIMNANMQFAKRNNPVGFYESYKLMTEYNFENDQLTNLSIGFPNEFTEKDFGLNSMPFVHLDRGNIYYSFSPLPYLYKFDLKNNKSIKLNPSIEGLPYYNYDYDGLSDELDGINMKSFMNNSNFGSIISTKNHLIRVYLSPNLEHKKDNVGNENLKESALQIFDKNLTSLENKKIENDLGLSGSFSDDESFFFPIALESENEINFLKISIE